MTASNGADIELLLQSKHFCILPWVHQYVAPNGDVRSCPVSSGDQYGNVNEKGLKEIWNGPVVKKLRSDMLSGNVPSNCSRCYEAEKTGGGTLRTYANGFLKQNAPVISTTSADGEVPNFTMGYVDIRFSTVCNFRCRSCGPHYSSAWRKDWTAVTSEELGPLENIRDTDALIAAVRDHADTVEEIYIAGGEPFLTAEVYTLLQELIRVKKTDMRMRIQTNFSTTSFRGTSAFELLKSFSKVNLVASLDAIGPRAEYVRQGTKWPLIEQNREILAKLAPNVNFSIQCTVGVLNCFNLLDLHRDWLRRGYLQPNSDFTLNLLQYPECMRIQIVPPALKEKLSDAYQSYAKTLPESSALRGQLASLIDYMWAQDLTSRIPEFLNQMQKMDKAFQMPTIRAAFPELEPVWNYIPPTT